MISENKAGVICMICVVVILGVLGLTATWSEQEAAADKFATECNATGGTARVIDGMRQCLRAAAPPEGKDAK